jgi:anti-anti-sigma factor
MSSNGCDFQMAVCWSAGWAVYLSGELDAATGPELEIVASALADARIAAVDFDLSEVTFVDTAGWTCLTAAMCTIEASGAVPRLRNVHPSVRRLMDVRHEVDEIETLERVAAGEGALAAPGPRR